MKQKLSLEPEKNPLPLLLPVKETVRVGVLGSSDEMKRVAVLDPGAWGENTIWMVQIWEGRRAGPVQFSFWMIKSMALGPLMVSR